MKKLMLNGIINLSNIFSSDIYSQRSRWKIFLLILAVSIGAWSLFYTHNLVKRLAEEERKKVELWAEATKIVAETTETAQVNFLLNVIVSNNTVPVILTNEKDSILFMRNLDSLRMNQNSYLLEQLRIMKNKHKAITINLSKTKRNYIYYNDSILITKLTIYPYIQLFVILIFVIVAYMAFHSSRSAEQNKVWLGLSRETAHQLGTPTSSLMAWVELLKEKDEVKDIVVELEKDVQRLNIITERFSKIGSQPNLELIDLIDVMKDVVNYMQHRIPKSVKIELEFIHSPLFVYINSQLFGWVIENLIKNALDAIKNRGLINIKVHIVNEYVIIDIHDTGKGIASRDLHKIFKPGFTTKKRGWGLGLSLTKRIIENYHNGKISVLDSTVNVGTTFRILVPNNNISDKKTWIKSKLK